MNERCTSWDNWSEEQELVTQKYYDQWLTAHIGKERSFNWGAIESIYDKKGGCTCVWINYLDNE